MIDQHKSLSEKFLKKGFWLYLFSFIIAPIAYIVKIIISSELTVSEVGILYGIISLITMIAAFNDFGMTESMNKFIPKYVTEKRYDKVKAILTYALITQMTTGILIASFFFFGADFIANNYFKTEEAKVSLKIFSIYFIGINIFQIITTFFLAIQNTLYNKIIDFLRMTFILGTTLFVLYSDIGSLETYTYSWIIGLYVSILFSSIIFYKKIYKTYFNHIKIIWSKKLFKEIFKYSIIVFLGAQAATILSQIDMQMIIYILGTLEAGYYTNYLSIIGIPFIVIGPILALLFPLFSEMDSKNEIDKIKLVKEVFQKNFIAIGIALNILFFIFAEIIAIVLFGEKFSESGVILKYSILFLVFNFLLQINFSILAGIGKVKERLYIILIAIIFNVILNLILLNLMGVYGAALATGLGWILIWILSEYCLGQKYKTKINYLFLFKNIIFMSIIGYILHIFILPLLNSENRVNLLIYMTLITIAWFTIFSILNIKEFRLFTEEIKKLKKG